MAYEIASELYPPPEKKGAYQTISGCENDDNDDNDDDDMNGSKDSSSSSSNCFSNLRDDAYVIIFFL